MDANDQRARLVAEWHIYNVGNRETLLRRIITLNYDLPAGPVSAEDVAPAYSQLLLQLSEAIAAAISADYASHTKTTDAKN